MAKKRTTSASSKRPTHPNPSLDHRLVEILDSLRAGNNPWAGSRKPEHIETAELADFVIETQPRTVAEMWTALRKAGKPGRKIRDHAWFYEAVLQPCIAKKLLSVGGADTAEPDSRWKAWALDYLEGPTDIRAIVIYDRIDRRSDPRVWFRDVLEDAAWTRIDEFAVEGETLRLDFTVDRFKGMPAHLYLEVPKQPAIGSLWRLRYEDGKRLFGTFRVVSADEISGAKLNETESKYWR